MPQISHKKLLARLICTTKEEVVVISKRFQNRAYNNQAILNIYGELYGLVGEISVMVEILSSHKSGLGAN